MHNPLFYKGHKGVLSCFFFAYDTACSACFIHNKIKVKFITPFKLFVNETILCENI